MDYFRLFGLPVGYQLDVAGLSSRYQDLQRQFHPDRFAAKPERERLMALQQAATINDAYQTLRHPISRAEYMLSLQGFDLRSEQHTFRDTAFLMQQLELREELDDIAQRDDAEQALSSFTQRRVKMTEAHSEQLQQQLESQQWAMAADSVRKLRFLDKLQQQIELIEERLLGF